MVICPSGSLRFTDGKKGRNGLERFRKNPLEKGAAHTMSSEELAMLPLEPGKNIATYHVPALEVTIISLIQYISSILHSLTLTSIFLGHHSL